MISGILIFALFINIPSLFLLFAVLSSVQVFIPIYPLFVEYKKNEYISYFP